jgi:fibronectin-binding autotransporter adhesin
MLRTRTRTRTALAVAFALAGPAALSHADVISKDNNTNNLNLGSSWVGGNAPGSSDVARWNSTVDAANATALGADLSWQGIEIVDPGGNVTINAGNTLTLGSAGIDMSNATANLTINSGVTLGASQTWSVASGQLLSLPTAAGPGAVNLGAHTLTFSGPGNTILGNGISGTGHLLVDGGETTWSRASSASQVTISGGTLLGTGDNTNSTFTVSGATLISGGTLETRNRRSWTTNSMSISNGGHLFTSQSGGATTNLTIGAGGLELVQFASGAWTAITLRNSTASNDNSNTRLNLNGNLTFTGHAGNSNTTVITATGTLNTEVPNRNGSIVITAERQFNIGNGAADVDLDIQTRIFGTNGILNKTGAGTLALSGVAAHTGGSIVSAGRLLINGTHETGIAVNGGTLGGSGTVTGAVTVANNATIAPGNSAGTLNVGALTLNSLSNLVWELGTASDLLVVNGNLTLDGLLSVEALAGFGAGVYTLMTYSGSITDNGLTVVSMPGLYEGVVFVDPTAKTVNLSVAMIPEPGSLALVLAGAAMIASRKRRA